MSPQLFSHWNRCFPADIVPADQLLTYRFRRPTAKQSYCSASFSHRSAASEFRDSAQI